jgi:hypothetical protein
MPNEDESNKDEIAARFARDHFQVEPDIVAIYRVVANEREQRPSEPVKLLEVNANTPAAGIRPIHFGPDHAAGIQHALVVIEITPEEYTQLLRGELRLPEGWTVAQELRRAS